MFETPADLLAQLITIGDKLIAADKLNFVAPNTIKRILHLIREASKHHKLDKETNQNLSKSIGGMSDFGFSQADRKGKSRDDLDFMDGGLRKLEFENVNTGMSTSRSTI